MTLESAQQLYDRLSAGAKGKERISLERLKAICDDIAKSRSVMNYSRVGKLAVLKCGGPRAQSIANNPRLKHYVSARILEYEAPQVRRKRQSGSGEVQSTVAPRYPASDLDPRTKVFIDRLHDKIEFLERVQMQLRKLLEESTQANPPSIAKVIGDGPGGNAELRLDLSTSAHPSKEIAWALKQVLELEPAQAQMLINPEPRALLSVEHGITKTVWGPDIWLAIEKWCGNI